MVNVGDKFGRWVVVVPYELNGYTKCKCVCGEIKNVHRANLTSGKSKSCGCLSREMAGNRKTHGMSSTKIYATWNRMLSRCSNPTVDRYKNYGGRGIKVCKRWLKFDNFYVDMGDIPSKNHSIGRNDNDGNYELKNCQWETRDTQMNNTSRSIIIEYEGSKISLTQWSRKKNISYSKLIARYNKGIRPPELFEKQDNNKKIITASNGESMLITKWMKKLKIPISTFYLRIRQGKSHYEIVESYLHRYN